jgi:hypothetical protein
VSLGGILFLVGLFVLLPLLVILEGKRQEKTYGKPTGRGGMTRVGLLELQRHLQPDRKVEVMLQEERREESEDDAGERPPTRKWAEPKAPPTESDGS